MAEIIEVLKELNIPYREHGQHEHATSGWVQIDCPFCTPDYNYFRLGINLRWGNTNCWACGTHRLTEVLAEITGSGFHAARSILKQVVFTRGPKHGTARRGKLHLPEGLGDLSPPHIKYLQGRGFDPTQLIQLWHLQGIGIHPPLSWRIFIPIFYRGEMVSWTTRSLGKTGPRYRNAKKDEEIYPAKKLLFGEDYCRQTVVVCEGPFDAMKIGPGAVATLGVGYNTAQVARLSKYPRRVVCFDNEKQAQKRAQKLCDELNLFSGETFNVQLDAKDPGEAGPKEIKRLRKMLE